MNNRASAAVFSDVIGGILAADIYPANIKLGLEQVCGNCIIENIEGVFAAEFHKFEIVVVIKHLHTEILCGFAEYSDKFNNKREVGSTRSVFRNKVGNGNIFAADLRIG